MPTAFVTGATGLLGSNLVKTLLAAGYSVRALVRSIDKARAQLAGQNVQLVRGDMTDVPAFAGALAGVDVVFHTAAYFRDSLKGGSHWPELARVNIDGTRALLTAAHAAGVRRFIHTSSIAVVKGARPGALVDESQRRTAAGEPNDYYRSKIESDRVVDEFLAQHPDFSASFILPAFMNGPGDAGPTSAGQLLIDFAERRLPGIVDASFSYVDARDVAAAEVAAVERGRRGERYLVAGRALHFSQAMALLQEVSGIAAPKRRLPMFVVALVALCNELWARLSGRPVLLSWSSYRSMRNESTQVNFDSSKARRELGVQFRPLSETFRDAFAWLRAANMIKRGETQAPSEAMSMTKR